MGNSSSKTSLLTPVDDKKRAEVIIDEKPQFWMHLDADRDGKVDDDFNDLDKWTWGAKGRGAIVLVNNNAKGPGETLDNIDAKVNEAVDVKDIAPLDIRRRGPAAPAGWTVQISIPPEHRTHIRIFDARTDAGQEIIGPIKGVTHVFTDLAFEKKELGMEAIKYAEDGFDGFVDIELTLLNGKKKIQEQTARVRVGPWIAFNHLNAPERLYVVKTDDNAAFVAELEKNAAASGLTVQPAREREDRWMQDIMEFGYSQLPGQAPLRTVLETPRGRELNDEPRFLVSPELGYAKPVPVPPEPQMSSLNSGGNLECTPPFTAPDGKHFPFGRLYFCEARLHDPTDRLAPGYAEFLDAQKVQQPLRIDASWLNVGHVDEMVSFIPANNKLGFKLLLASPALGMKILSSPEASGAKMLVGRTYAKDVPAEISVADFLNRGIAWNTTVSRHPSFVMSAREIKAYNVACQSKIAKAEKIFQKALGLGPDDIAYVPSIYVHPISAPGQVLQADALTAGMVNMLVLGKKCISPKPFGPVVAGKDLFEEHFRSTLAKDGLSVAFIDDWDTYHLLNGEVHCGTNTLRKADSATKWWEFIP